MYFFEKYTHYPKIYFLSKAKDLGKHWYEKVLLFKIAFKILGVVLGYLPDIPRLFKRLGEKHLVF